MAEYSSFEVQCNACGKMVVRQLSEVLRVKHVFCSVKCKCISSSFRKYAAQRNGDVQRGRGNKRTYTKRNGRHEHRIVAEQKIGRPLAPGEIVHHIDGNKKNNTPENLEVMTQSEHVKLHISEMMAKRYPGKAIKWK